MNATSAWLLAANTKLNDPELVPDFEGQASRYSLKYFLLTIPAGLLLAGPKAAGSLSV